MIQTHEYNFSKEVFFDPGITNVCRILSFVHFTFYQVQWACFPNDVYVKRICIQQTRVPLFPLLMSLKLSVTAGPYKARSLNNNHLTFLCSCNFIFPELRSGPVQEMFLERVKINYLPVAARQAEQAAFLWVISPLVSWTWEQSTRAQAKNTVPGSEERQKLRAR